MLKPVLAAGLLCGALTFSATAAKPSFDCSKPADAHEAELIICGDDGLAQLDVELARLYRLAHDGPHATAQRKASLVSEERAFVNDRNECWKAQDKPGCIAEMYVRRIHQIRQGYADARTQDGKGISVGPVAVRCEGMDATIGASFVNGDDAYVYLEWLEDYFVLKREQAGSGVKYAKTFADGATYVFWTQGDEAILTQPGEDDKSCTIEEIG